MVDLIYTDKNRIDIGVIRGYNLDLAYGKDENNFVLELPLKNTDISSGCCIYMEGTDIGGIIDKPGVSTKEKKILFSGRTWHGVLAGHILCPEKGVDYLFFDGEANEVLREIIELLGLTDLFDVSSEDSGIEVDNYICRYADAYTAITDMLFQATGKLHMEYRKGRVELSAIPYIDYSQNEEWDAAHRNFTAERNDRPVNHLVCLGGGNLAERHVIHLYADENGGLMPYSTVEQPLKDEDYILDETQQQLYGIDEVAEVYDYGNAEDTDNYVLLTAKPSDFDSNYGAYYMLDENSEEYIHPEAEVQTVYALLTAKPSDWDSMCEKYYVCDNDNSGYSQVIKELVTNYTALTTQPTDWAKKYGGYYTKSGSKYYKVSGLVEQTYKKVADKTAKKGWKKKYSDYYTRMWDGTQYIYTRVSGVTKYKYVVQTKKPSDWSTNYTSYFQKKEKSSGYEKIPSVAEGEKAPTWKKKKYYTAYSYTKAPKFEKEQTYYVLKSKTVAPEWESGKYYAVSEVEQAPTWEAAKYYYVRLVTYHPQWAADMYYVKYTDHYADLVEKGLKKMKNYYDCDSIKIELNPLIEYDIGDVVGASEHITGLYVFQPITKKIVTINNKKKTIAYKVGGK